LHPTNVFATSTVQAALHVRTQGTRIHWHAGGTTMKAKTGSVWSSTAGLPNRVTTGRIDRVTTGVIQRVESA